jgi:putative cell wall-binding protein
MVPGAVNASAGNLAVTLAPTATGTTAGGSSCSIFAHPAHIALTVADFNEGANVHFDHVPTVTAPSTAGNSAFTICSGTLNFNPTLSGGGSTLNIYYSAGAATTAPQPINITGIGYDVLGGAYAPGPVVLRGIDTDLGYGPASGQPNNITPNSTVAVDHAGNPYDPPASNATIVSTSIFGVFADTTPVIAPGVTSAAGAWEITMRGTGNSWTAGDKIYLTVARNDFLNCETVGLPDSIGFSAVPNVSAQAASGGATATPTVTASLASMGSCASFSGVNNVLVLTYTNSGTITGGTATDAFGHPYSAELTISGINYAVSGDVGDPNGPTANLGLIGLSGFLNVPPAFSTSFVPNDTIVGGVHTPGAVNGPINADIETNLVTVKGNTPSVTLQTNITSTGASVTNQPISPITITESSPGALGGGVTGYACVRMAPAPFQKSEWNGTTSAPVATLGGGFAAGTVPVTIVTTGTLTGADTLEFQIPAASSGTPGTVTLSGLAVNVNTTAAVLPKLQANLRYGAVNAACSTTFLTSSSNPFTLANVAGRTFGQTQDATAAQVFQNNLPVCTSGVPSATNETPAVLVTDASYQDALSASYLAGNLGTGILTTPTATLSADALAAIRLAGVTEVFVVGGPLAVSQANVTQLQNTPSFNCGGTSQRTTIDGQPVDLVVQQIFGQTADGTAAAVATFPGPKPPGTGAFQAAYTGQYNDTSGSDGSPTSAAPDSPVTTAVLATDTNFQDAASASAIAYNSLFPLLLTGSDSLSPDAVTAITNDAIQQVIVMGGPIAISDNVVTQLEGLGVAVLRVAGQDFTDTSQLLAQFELNSVVPAGQPLAGQTNGLDYEPFFISNGVKYLTVARGDYYTDAIVISRLSFNSPILLTWDPNNTGNPSGTNYLGTFLHTVGQVTSDPGSPTDGTINNLLLVGGTYAISPALETTLGSDLNG